MLQSCHLMPKPAALKDSIQHLTIGIQKWHTFPGWELTAGTVVFMSN